MNAAEVAFLAATDKPADPTNPLTKRLFGGSPFQLTGVQTSSKEYAMEYAEYKSYIQIGIL